MHEINFDENATPSSSTKFLVCDLCGREFGSASLPIHHRQCALKQEQQRQQRQPSMVKKFKARKVPANIMGDHPVTSPLVVESLRAKSSTNSVDRKVPAGAVGNHETYNAVLDGTLDVRTFNKLALDSFEKTAVDRGIRVECSNCGRKFNRPEGLSKHKVLCDKSGAVFARNKSRAVRSELDKEETQTVVISPALQPKPSQNAESKSTSADASGEGGRFCVQCGKDFHQHVDHATWKYCPSCGRPKQSLPLQE